MLVFKDQKGQVWQISKVEDLEDFEELLDEAEPQMTYFKPGATIPLA